METENKQYIQNFIPIETRLDSATSAELSLFHAGDGFVVNYCLSKKEKLS